MKLIFIFQSLCVHIKFNGICMLTTSYNVFSLKEAFLGKRFGNLFTFLNYQPNSNNFHI
jgi:hypothetical protein